MEIERYEAQIERDKFKQVSKVQLQARWRRKMGEDDNVIVPLLMPAAGSRAGR